MNTSLLYHISDCQYTVCAIWIEIRQYGLVCGDTSHGRDYGDIPKNICSSVPVSKILRRLTNLETALLKLSDKVGQCQWQNDSSVETRNSWFCFSIPQQQSLHFVSFPRYCTVRFWLQIKRSPHLNCIPCLIECHPIRTLQSNGGDGIRWRNWWRILGTILAGNRWTQRRISCHSIVHARHMLCTAKKSSAVTTKVLCSDAINIR